MRHKLFTNNVDDEIDTMPQIILDFNLKLKLLKKSKP